MPSSPETASPLQPLTHPFHQSNSVLQVNETASCTDCSYVPRAGQPASGSVTFTDIKVLPKADLPTPPNADFPPTLSIVPTLRSQGGAVSHERGSPVLPISGWETVFFARVSLLDAGDGLAYVPRAGQPSAGSVTFTDILHCLVWAIWERDLHRSRSDTRRPHSCLTRG